MADVQRLTVILTSADYARLDAYCREQGHKKSTLVAKLVREYLATLPESEQLALPLLKKAQAKTHELLRRQET